MQQKKYSHTPRALAQKLCPAKSIGDATRWNKPKFKLKSDNNREFFSGNETAKWFRCMDCHKQINFVAEFLVLAFSYRASYSCIGPGR